MKLTIQQINDLAEMERRMDAGLQPYVVHHGERWSVTPEIMKELGLESGQTASYEIITAILESSLRNMRKRKG